MKKLIIAGFLVLVLAAAFVWGRPAYHNWKHDRFLKQTREFLAQGDLRNAALSARQALTLQAGDVEATRIMARVTESFRSPVAISWYQRVVDLEPGVVQNRLDLARAALMLGDFAKADLALSTIPVTNRNSVAFHQLAAMVAVAEYNIAQADWHFTEAAKLEPQNKLLLLNQAILHLQAKNPDLVQSATKTLEALSDDPTFRKDALRHLAMTAVRNQDFTQAEAFSRQLQTGEQSSFEDRILFLSILDKSTSPDFTAHLEALKAESIKNPPYIPTLTGWLSTHKRLDEAIAWLTGLPATIQATAPFRAAMADAYSEHGDWAKLQSFLQDQDWGEFEFARHAQLARAARKLKQDIVAEDQWAAAVRAAADRVKALSVLARLAAAWKMETEREDLLWTIAQRYPGERWALHTLNDYYLATRNTPGLQKIYSTLVDYDPNDIVAKNNLAAICLLLNVQLNKANEMAHAAYGQAPNNPAFATTYAFSLHLQGRTAEGLKILNTLPAEQLESPSIAVYYGVLLSAAGETAQAKKYLALAATDKSLLPEEYALVKAAR